MSDKARSIYGRIASSFRCEKRKVQTRPSFPLRGFDDRRNRAATRARRPFSFTQSRAAAGCVVPPGVDKNGKGGGGEEGCVDDWGIWRADFTWH